MHTFDTHELAVPHRDPAVVERRRVHALVFDDPTRTLAAVKRLRAEGFDVGDVHSPFPVHGMEEALGMRPTRLAWATLIGGLAGGSLKLLFQSWVHIVDWPMNIGGKPDFSLPALQPHPGVTDDRFVVLVMEHDGAFSPARFRSVSSMLGAQEVVEGWRV